MQQLLNFLSLRQRELKNRMDNLEHSYTELENCFHGLMGLENCFLSRGNFGNVIAAIGRELDCVADAVAVAQQELTHIEAVVEMINAGNDQLVRALSAYLSGTGRSA
ncbi:MAG: hypothetical protein AB1330_01100 [Bacillota bacterium]